MKEIPKILSPESLKVIAEGFSVLNAAVLVVGLTVVCLALIVYMPKYSATRSRLMRKIFCLVIFTEIILMSFMDNSLAKVAVMCGLSIILFPELMVYISKYPHKRTGMLKKAFCFMFFGGMLFYYYCHYRGLEQVVSGLSNDKYLEWAKNANASWLYIPYVAMRSFIDVGMMFYGRGNADVFYSLPESKYPLAVLVFWLLHVIVFLTAASALLIRFGDDLLRWIRTKTQVSCIDIIFGVNADSLAFSRNITGPEDRMLIYVKDIRADKTYTRLRLYALSHEYDKNLQYARMMSQSLEELKISPEQTELVLLGTDESKGMFFQSGNVQYGYGNVLSFDEYEMSARLLIHKYPLCNFINFDHNGRAIDDMEVLIGGFGRIGHEVLRKIIANGQFEGSRLTITIFDPKHGDRTGFIRSQYPKMFAAPGCEIEFISQDIRSGKSFDFLKEHAPKLKYIVICLEDGYTARDIAVRMTDPLHVMGYARNVYTCNPKGVRCYSHNAGECATHWIYDSELLCSGDFDRYAMELTTATPEAPASLKTGRNVHTFTE